MRLKNIASLALVIGALSPFVAGADTGETSEAAGPPGLVPAFITAGYPDPAGIVPTINKVSGSGVTNLDISFPVTVLTPGQQYVYSSTVSFELTQVQNGTTVTLDSGTITTFKTAPGDVWLWVATGAAIPASPGVATLTGLITYGSKTAKTSTTVVIQ
jgi:hypothetical protein